MVSRAPIEVWTRILEETIDVPEFFSDNPLGRNEPGSWVKFRHEEYYWRSERWRTDLRRVHSSWNDLLNQSIYRHRFVRISDITHKRLSEEEIPWSKTIRIIFGAEPGCNCDQLCQGWDGLRGISQPVANAVLDIVARAADRIQGTIWRLKVVDGVEYFDPQQFQQAFRQAPRLSAVSTSNFWSSMESGRNSLRLLHLRSRAYIGLKTPMPESKAPSFASLTTLILELPMQRFLVENWLLPSLRYLHISASLGVGDKFILDRLGKILEAMGSNLHTLHIDYNRLHGAIPISFWSLVPKLKQIRFNNSWKTPPPHQHPLNAISLHNGLTSEMLNWMPGELSGISGWQALRDSSGDEYGTTPPEYGKLVERRMSIAFTDLWEFMLCYQPLFNPCVDIGQRCAKIGWRFTDYGGLTFSEFLVLTLKNRKERRKLSFLKLGRIRRHSIARRDRDGETDRDVLGASFNVLESF